MLKSWWRSSTALIPNPNRLYSKKVEQAAFLVEMELMELIGGESGGGMLEFDTEASAKPGVDDEGVDAGRERVTSASSRVPSINILTLGGQVSSKVSSKVSSEVSSKVSSKTASSKTNSAAGGIFGASSVSFRAVSACTREVHKEIEIDR